VYIYFNKVKNFVYVEFMKPPAWFISDIKLKVLGWILAEPGPLWSKLLSFYLSPDDGSRNNF
jgi:hypothetical protein